MGDFAGAKCKDSLVRSHLFVVGMDISLGGSAWQMLACEMPAGHLAVTIPASMPDS